MTANQPPARSFWSRLTRGQRVGAVAGLVFAGLVVVGIAAPDEEDGEAAGPAEATASLAPAEDVESVPAPDPAADADADAGAGAGQEVAVLPDLTGGGLQAAQDAAQAAGFHDLTSHDSLGRDRMQIMDRNWIVCFQSPGPGEHATDTEIDFGAVKLEEECPDEDSTGPVAEAGDTMPDLVGESVNVARDALPDGVGLTVRDVSGEDRMILVESNWQVCAQEPAPGTGLAGESVTLRAVKFEEPCP
ncbi:PASTA domain-containing protein [Streptomyces marincola]|uniref:PASTA domain-containing protein n=1 Tax=Streptomyces marincola TaxID=2878388 RepID=UPI001CF40F51|nr:PASTA domain-containing protein [Streptomyces marincola]UCM88818.1 hypothetical protein LC193_13125 [Streptomyces marincola]